LATIEDISDNVQFFRKHRLISHNQWPFRPLIVNTGAGFGQIMARRGVAPDPDYMCYRYSFADPKVQRVFDVVDELSAKTRSVFYSLKVISKAHFDPVAESLETKRARDFVMENGLVYLDLIERLVASSDEFLGHQSVLDAVKSAEQRIQSLIQQIDSDLSTGLFRKHSARLRTELAGSLVSSNMEYDVSVS
jgi:hypothetical protein